MEGSSSLQRELDVLQSKLKQSLDRATLWMTDETTQLVTAQTHRHDTPLNQLKDEKLKIEDQISARQKNAIETNQMLEERCKQLEQLKTELETLYGHTQQLTSTKQQGEQQLNKLNTQIETLKKDIEVPTKQRQTLEYLSKSSGVFCNMLGMTLKKTAGKRLQVTFTHIDEKDPLMPFYFFLQIQEPTKKYIVSDPEPPVSGLKELVDKLNTDNNMRAFILAMRSKFQQSVKSGSQHT